MKNIDKQLLSDMYKAYFEARRNKRNTISQLRFEMDLEKNLIDLTLQVQNETYQVGKSVAFIVDKPVKREIFAANFRDRVVHHLIFNYIGDFFEKRFVQDCYSCRKGLGTSYGIDRIEGHIRSATDNYTKEAYVLKLDIMSYFMSIDRNILYDKIERALKSNKNKNDKLLDRKLFLLKEVIFNDPTNYCVIKSKASEWDGLPPSKSLFKSAKDRGLPIGNLTSQLFSNIYMSEFDNYVKRELGIKHYGRYVDDFFMIHPSKEYLLKVLEEVTAHLKQYYHLEIHPKKIYLQNIKHGVTFLGGHMKPHRTYMRTSVLKDIMKNVYSENTRLLKMRCPNTNELEQVCSKLNSYLGYMKHFKTRGYRQRMWTRCEGYRKYFSCNSNWSKVTIKKAYSYGKDDYSDEERGVADLF